MAHTQSVLETTNDIWKDCQDNRYEVSNRGQVRVKERFVRHNYGGQKRIPQRILKQSSAGNYLKVHFSNSQKTVHRLVAEAFIDNPNDYPCVMHKDNNPHNNSVDNLMWGNHSMNALQCVRDGRHQGYETGVGKRRTEI